MNFFYKDKEERGWNIFDFCLVLYAVLDLILTKSLELEGDAQSASSTGGIALILRTARILRLFMIRFFCIIYSLHIDIVLAVGDGIMLY